MLLRNEAKVGLLVFAAIVVLIAMYWFLRGFGLGERTFPVYAVFADARKLDKGSDVRMAGVKIGFVEEVKLTKDSRARVDMTIWDDTCIPTDSIARITTGAFIGDYYVDVLPGSNRACLKDDMKMRSAEPMNYEKLVANVGDLVDELKVSVNGINSILADKQTVASVRETIKQLQLSTTAATQLISSAQGVLNDASPEIHQTLANMTQATGNAIKITDELNAMVKSDVRPDARAIMGQAKDAMTNLNETIREAKSIMSGFGGAPAKVDSTLAKIEDAAQQADELMKNLNAASGDIKDITSDKEMKKNIRDTMRNAAEATAQANTLLCTLNKKLGGITGNPVAIRKAQIPDYGLTTDSLWNTTEGSYRFDANYTFGLSSRSFARLGAFNVGEDTHANIQMGQILGGGASVRGGIYASRLGFGLDQKVGNCFLLSADGLRPNDPEYDLRAVLTFGHGIGLYGGYSNILNDKPDTFVGVHYAR